MSPRAVKVAVAVSALAVVCGLVVLAAPVFETVTGVIATVTSRAAASPATTASPGPAVPAESDASAAASEGYVSLPDGSRVPAGGHGDCAASAYLTMFKPDGGSWTATLTGDLVDMGTREFAVGEVGYAADGRIATYTVAPGDSTWAIGDRFCLYHGLALLSLNGYPGGHAIQPGDVLVLDPGAVPGFEYTPIP